MKKNYIVAILGGMMISIPASAMIMSDKAILQNNMIVVYKKTPKSVEHLDEVLSKGMVYGRFRTNAFYWDWTQEAKNSGAKDNKALGVGGSLIYKTAPFQGVSATVGFYASEAPSFFREDVQDVGKIKAGKDTISRYDASTTGHFSLNVVGQSYLEYDFAQTSIKVGRQLFESVFANSNDTKMIPNSFDGVSVRVKDFSKTIIDVGYFTRQKLRDHSTSHDVLAYDSIGKWTQNDDSGVNKNLTVQRIGDNNTLGIVSVTNKSFSHLKTNISYAIVPDVLSDVVLEAHYTINALGYKIIPGVRYWQQIDNLNANYDVANIAGNESGYKDPKSLDSSLIALRVDIKNKALLARIGYSKVADKADIIAPWRGFPTGGYTRVMGQKNWLANTKTYMVRVGYDFEKAHLLDGFSLMGRYAIEDFDDNKPGVQADVNALNIDARQKLSDAMELKVRLGFVSADVGNTTKKDTSYNEYRVELNYLF